MKVLSGFNTIQHTLITFCFENEDEDKPTIKELCDAAFKEDFGSHILIASLINKSKPISEYRHIRAMVSFKLAYLNRYANAGCITKRTLRNPNIGYKPKNNRA